MEGDTCATVEKVQACEMWPLSGLCYEETYLEDGPIQLYEMEWGKWDLAVVLNCRATASLSLSLSLSLLTVGGIWNCYHSQLAQQTKFHLCLIRATNLTSFLPSFPTFLFLLTVKSCFLLVFSLLHSSLDRFSSCYKLHIFHTFPFTIKLLTWKPSGCFILWNVLSVLLSFACSSFLYSVVAPNISQLIRAKWQACLIIVMAIYTS